MSAKKLLIFIGAFLQVVILGVTAYSVIAGYGTDIFIYLEAGFVGLCLLGALIFILSVSFGGLFFAFGGFIHLVLTLASVAATGYFAITCPDDLMLTIFLGACSFVMLVSLIPILCSKK